MQIKRHFTTDAIHPFDKVDYEKRSCVIKNADGSVVFEMHDIEVPRAWSQLASDIMISKYVRKAGLKTEPGHETSVRQVIQRLVHTARTAGEDMGNYFDTPQDAEAFEMELAHILVHQRGAFNSPVWFNCGLYHEYGIKGAGGNWRFNPRTETLEEMDNNYRNPQCSACFIQSVDDDLMSIFDLIKNEARIFKYGSGTGSNFSNIRGRQENLSGGGASSGLMSFLEVFDRAAGATKSGGTTRRAAKMVCLDADHPEIREFANWKRKEEHKVRALIAQGYPADFNGEAYHTVSGQNSNNSIRLDDVFMKAWENDEPWETRARTTGEVCDTFPARDLMKDIAESAWECADPGLQFDTTINEWHTCPNSGRINASNPCSEYMFLDDTACNLSSINLVKYLNEDGSFDLEAYLHTIRILFIAQEIFVGLASYPTPSIAQLSYEYRTLGLGYANLGTLLMILGLPYDSDAGRAVAAALTSIMTGHAYEVSAEMARDMGPFVGHKDNAEPMLAVIRKHREEVDAIAAKHCPDYLIQSAKQCWDAAIEKGGKYGYRNAQATVLAPTGTIGLLMDCDTTGVEPDFSLVKFKKLAGGGYFKIINGSVNRALKTLGYEPHQIDDVVQYIVGTQSFKDAPHVNYETLSEFGLTETEILRLEKLLPTAFDIGQVFNVYNMGVDVLERLGVQKVDYQSFDFDLLEAWGLSAEEIQEANEVVCGRLTIEGAPHLDSEHYVIFDCANKCGPKGKRFIEPMGHIRMMAAVQPFISGAISKTINMPNETTVLEIESAYVEAWNLGLKAVALYRDGCKSSQPLNSSKTSTKKESASAEEIAVAKKAERGQLELFPEIAEYGPVKRPLPKRRTGITIEANVGSQKVYLRTGDYEDGQLGEIFIDMAKEGSSFRSMMMCFAIAVSKGLQHGVPLREFVDSFTFTSFKPDGVCDHPNIKMVTSVIDYVFRVLGMEYLGRTDFCQVPPEEAKSDDNDDGEDHQVSPTETTSEEVMPEQIKAASAVTAPVMKNGINGTNGNGNGTAHAVASGVRKVTPVAVTAQSAIQSSGSADPMARHLGDMMGDAPFCDTCGHITVRNGSCYKCLNCGESMGCS